MVSSRTLVAAIAVVAMCSVAVRATNSVCGTGTKFGVGGATFDVTNLMRTGVENDYIVTDGDIPCTSTVEKNYTYIFDICGDVTGENKPAACAGLTGPAFQFDVGGVGDCHLVGADGSFNLINTNDPSEGIQLVYASGEQCHHDGAPQRKMTITMGCANILIPTPTVANEPEHCQYYVEMNSVYGCPLECPLGGDDRELCSGHGICAWDKTNEHARCFCDEGYIGTDCNSKSSDGGSGSNGAVIGLLVTVLLIAVVLGVVLFFVIRMLRAYRQDAHNYMAMHNQDLGTQDI